MKKIMALSLTIMVSFTMSSIAQDEIKTVFLTTHNDNGSVLPILIKKGRTLDANGTEIGAWTNGTRTVDRYMGLVRIRLVIKVNRFISKLTIILV